MSLNVSLKPSKCLQSVIETIKMRIGQIKYFHIGRYWAKTRAPRDGEIYLDRNQFGVTLIAKFFQTFFEFFDFGSSVGSVSGKFYQINFIKYLLKKKTVLEIGS